MTLMIASNSRKDTIRPLMTRPDQSMTFEAGTVSACENEAGRAVDSINFPPVKFKPSVFCRAVRPNELAGRGSQPEAGFPPCPCARQNLVPKSQCLHRDSPLQPESSGGPVP